MGPAATPARILKVSVRLLLSIASINQSTASLIPLLQNPSVHLWGITFCIDTSDNADEDVALIYGVIVWTTLSTRLHCRYIVYPCHRWGPQPDHLAQIQAGLLISWASCTKSNVRFEKIWKKARWWSTINIFAMPAWICKQSYFLTRWSTWWGGPAGCITWTNVWHLHEWPHGNWASEDLLRHQNPSKSISSETPSWCI